VPLLNQRLQKGPTVKKLKKLLLGSIILALAAAASPAIAADEVTKITLTEPFGEYHPADGGRALVFYFPKAKQVAVYDTVRGRIRGSIKVASNDVRIAASKDAIFVALVDQGMIETYSAATLQKGKVFPIPDKRTLKEMAAGSMSTTGPLWINTGERIIPINPATGSGIKAEGDLPLASFDYRVSSDGQTLVAWAKGPGDQKFLVTRLRGETLTTMSSADRIPMPNRRFQISANGSLIFFEGRIYDGMMQPLPTVKNYTNMLPTSDPRFFIAVKGEQDSAKEIAICSVGDRKILAEIPDIGALGGWTAVGDLPRVATVNEAAAGNGEPRVVFLPNEKIIATISEGNKEILIRPFDLAAVMDKAGDYLFVDSFPPTTEALPGKPFQYQAHAVSKKGKIKYELQTGPTGMTVSADGKVSWTVPADFTGNASVIVSVTDSTNQSAYHSFTLAGPPGTKTAVAPPTGGGGSGGPVVVGGGPTGGPVRVIMPSGGGIGGVTGQNVMTVRAAVTGERAKGDPTKLQPLTTVHGMVVSRGPDGEYHGSAVEIFATESRDAKGLITIRGTVGKEMRVSLDEAIRLVEIKQPKLDRASIDLSFSDKYSTKDGGSAGTAFALLLLASMGEFELNPEAAITGDITIDSKVRTVGQTPAKAHGAALDKMKVIAIPEGNAAEFDDAMIMQGAAPFWEAQIFTVKTLDDAIAVMRKDPDAKLAEAMKLFDKLKADFSTKAPAMLAQAGQKEIVAKILELAPNHLSAKNLQLISTAKQPKILSAMGTVKEAMRAMGPMRTALSDDEPHPELVKNGSIAKARQGLEKVLRVADKAAQPVVVSLDQFCAAYLTWSVVATDAKATPDQKQRAYTTLTDKAKAVDSAMDAVVSDREVVDKMMRD
jgi:hypothetical protein